MSKRDRRDGEGRERREYDRRDNQPEDEHQHRPTEGNAQEGDSLAALKVILSKVAALLRPLNLTPDESIGLVEQLYGNVLDMDVRLASEADDTRKSITLAHIQNATIRREGDRIVVEYPTSDQLQASDSKANATADAVQPAAPGGSPEDAPAPGTPSPTAAAEAPGTESPSS